MRIRTLALALALAVGATFSGAAVEPASAGVFISQKKVISNGFRTCKFVRQTAIGTFGGFAHRSVAVCRSAF